MLYPMLFSQKQVLFLCRVNGARSLMAEAVTNAFGGDGLRAHGAGLEPIEFAPKLAFKVLEERGIPTIGLKPKSLSEFIGPQAKSFDFVITTCGVKASEVCPTQPGQPVLAQWNLPSPTGGEDVAQLYREMNELYDALYRCVNIFLNLPLKLMDKFAIEHEIDDIGLGVVHTQRALEVRLAI